MRSKIQERQFQDFRRQYVVKEFKTDKSRREWAARYSAGSGIDIINVYEFVVEISGPDAWFEERIADLKKFRGI